MGDAVTSRLIDVWNAETFDPELTTFLNRHSDLAFGYYETDRQIFLTHDRGRGSNRSTLRPQNSHAPAFIVLKEEVCEHMRRRTIRAWHYARLTDTEVEIMLRDGIHLSTPVTLRTRLDALVTSGQLAKMVADALYSKSPFHSDQRKSTSSKFWMTSHPITIDDGGIQPLITHWGGEAASMWTKDPTLLGPLAAIGKSRIVELAVPMAITEHPYSAGEAVIATFGRTLGCIPSKHDFDLYATSAMQSDAVLKIHTEGDTVFETVGRTYPLGFVDIDVGRWKELTGEDD